MGNKKRIKQKLYSEAVKGSVGAARLFLEQGGRPPRIKGKNAEQLCRSYLKELSDPAVSREDLKIAFNALKLQLDAVEVRQLRRKIREIARENKQQDVLR